jgi:hypothetical protein
MNPLLFADWRSIATTFTVVCWLAVLVLGMTIAGAAESHGASASQPPKRVSLNHPTGAMPTHPLPREPHR